LAYTTHCELTHEYAKWERETLAAGVHAYSFPEPDLLYALVVLYFTHVNAFYPVLHRPTLQLQLAEGLHRTDPQFGAVMLLVCANGARFSSDPRVISDSTDSFLSAGWKWYDQAQLSGNAPLSSSRLWDLQAACVRS
jgi:hypothetical protein